MSDIRIDNVEFAGNILSIRDGKLTVNGVTSTYSEGERITGIHHKTLSFRVRNFDKYDPQYIAKVLSRFKLNTRGRRSIACDGPLSLSNEWLRASLWPAKQKRARI